METLEEQQSEFVREKDGFFQNRIILQAGIAIIGAAASIACFRTGYFIFLFLLPLALAAFFGDPKTAWATGILAIAFNIIVAVGFYLSLEAEPFLLQLNALYYTVIVLVFTWINVPIGKFRIIREVPFRMILGAAFCAVIFVPLFLYIVHNGEIMYVFAKQLNAIGALSSAAGEGGSTVEELVSGTLYILLRGGVPLSCLVFWWVNRQFGLFISRFFRRNQAVKTVAILSFHVPFFMVWILSFSLGAILLGRIGNIEILDITGWNILVLSATLFLVQGGAVLMHFLIRIPPLPRILINVGIIILLFRPGVNAAMLGVLVLLGIVENWVPFRAPKQ